MEGVKHRTAKRSTFIPHASARCRTRSGWGKRFKTVTKPGSASVSSESEKLLDRDQELLTKRGGASFMSISPQILKGGDPVARKECISGTAWFSIVEQLKQSRGSCIGPADRWSGASKDAWKALKPFKFRQKKLTPSQGLSFGKR